MNRKQLYEYALLYYPYSRNPDWANWFVKVAPLKVERTLKTLLQYKKKRQKF